MKIMENSFKNSYLIDNQIDYTVLITYYSSYSINLSQILPVANVAKFGVDGKILNFPSMHNMNGFQTSRGFADICLIGPCWTIPGGNRGCR